MSAGLRDQRVKVYAYSNAGTEGKVLSTYTLVPSGDTDKAWWARKETPTGREGTVAEQAADIVDAVFAFHDEVTVTPNGLLVHGSERYKVTAVLPRRLAREIQVLAVRSADATHALVES